MSSDENFQTQNKAFSRHKGSVGFFPAHVALMDNNSNSDKPTTARQSR